MDDIQRAQVEAAENAVVERLRAKGLLPPVDDDFVLVMQPTTELVFQDENGTGTQSPFVALYVDGVQRDKVWAYLDRAQGADGGWYSVIKFRR